MIARTTIGITAAAAYIGALLTCFCEKFQSEGLPPYGLVSDCDASEFKFDVEVDVAHSDELPMWSAYAVVVDVEVCQLSMVEEGC